MATERTLWMVTVAGMAAVTAAIVLMTPDRQPAAAPAVAPAAARAAAPARPPLAWLADPMEASSPAAARPAYIVQREKTMRALMIASPPQYYTMALATLRELARTGDADAMLQLAQQLSNEEARLRADPDFPAGADARALARQYLADALLAGRIRAAALLSRQLFDANQVGDAYAWRLVSEQLGDGVNPAWGADTNQFAGLSAAEKAAAAATARGLVDTMLRNRMQQPAR